VISSIEISKLEGGESHRMSEKRGTGTGLPASSRKKGDDKRNNSFSRKFQEMGCGLAKGEFAAETSSTLAIVVGGTG